MVSGEERGTKRVEGERTERVGECQSVFVAELWGRVCVDLVIFLGDLRFDTFSRWNTKGTRGPEIPTPRAG